MRIIRLNGASIFVSIEVIDLCLHHSHMYEYINRLVVVYSNLNETSRLKGSAHFSAPPQLAVKYSSSIVNESCVVLYFLYILQLFSTRPAYILIDLPGNACI